ncbi:MAG: hypothetical protein QXN56_06990, partial [Candidatus Hadarchaeum sp.]
MRSPFPPRVDLPAALAPVAEVEKEMLRFAVWLRDAEPFVQVPGMPGRSRPGAPVLEGESAEAALRVYEHVSGRPCPEYRGRAPAALAARLAKALQRFESEPASLEAAEELLDAWYRASVKVYGKEATVAFYESHIKPQLVSISGTALAPEARRVWRWRRAMRAWLRHARAVIREMTALDLARRVPHDGEEAARLLKSWHIVCPACAAV